MGQLNDIRFEKTNGGMGRTAPSEDPISGLLMYMPEFAEADLIDSANIKQFDKISKPDNINDLYVAKIRYADELADYGFVKESMKAEDLTQLDLAAFLERAAKNAVVYHVSEFFRMNETGTLYLGIKFGTSADIEKEDVAALQNYTNGVIRQCGVLASKTTNFVDYQSACTALETAHKPMSIVATTSGMTVNYTTSETQPPYTHTQSSQSVVGLKLTDFAGTSNPLMAADRSNLSFLIGCDLDGDTLESLAQYGYYGCLGACIGAISKAAVHECIAWVQKFPLTLKAPGLICDALIKDVVQANLELINDNRYLFVLTHVGDADNYFNDSHTLDVATSDYAYIENVRTIDKATRGIRKNLLPYLNSPLYVDPETGKLESNMVAFLETTAGKALEDMEKAGELSGYKVEINPEQNVIATSQVEIIIKKVPVGVMRKVFVKIGFTTKLN